MSREKTHLFLLSRLSSPFQDALPGDLEESECLPPYRVLQALWSADPSSPVAHALQAAVNDFCLLMEQLGTKLGRGAQREALNCRGLKIARYPRWPVRDVRGEDRRTLQTAIEKILTLADTQV